MADPVNSGPRYVVLRFEVDERFTPGVHLTDAELEQQIEDFITGLESAPASWVWDSGEVTR